LNVCYWFFLEGKYVPEIRTLQYPFMFIFENQN
jgi:hypothetical protein